MDSHSMFPQTVFLLERSMDLRSLRHRTLVSNIANIDTPNYKAFDLMVEEELDRLQEGQGSAATPAVTHARHIPLEASDGPSPRPTPRRLGSPGNFRGDGNTVDLDKEMAEMSENQLLYNASAQIIGRKFRSLKTAIHGGKQ